MDVNICDKIRHRDSTYRVTGFLKKMSESSIWNWQFVPKAEATHVSGSGICGCIVALEDAVVVGNMNDVWSATNIAISVAEADRMSQSRTKV